VKPVRSGVNQLGAHSGGVWAVNALVTEHDMGHDTEDVVAKNISKNPLVP
jgi:hypothetical protein